MNATIPYPNMRTLLVVLCIFIGNAQILGIDIVLFFLLPILLLITSVDFTIIRSTIYGYMFLFLMWAMLSLITLQGIKANIPYFEYYWFWPIKAVILSFIISVHDQPKWNRTDTWILLLFALCLIFVGHFKDGRLYSIFGPNMLYRLFAILLIFSLMQKNHTQKGIDKLTGILAFSLGMIGIFLTGSAGGIFLVLIILIYYFYLLNDKKLLLLIILMGFFIYIGSSVLHIASYDSDITAISRIIYKLGTFATSERWIGLSDIFSRPFSFWGGTYFSFSNIWTSSYPYPHNILAEIYAFYGILGLVLISIIIIVILNLYNKKLSSNVYILTFIVVTGGSLLSGDLSDNYGVVAVSVGYLLNKYTVAVRAGA